MASGNRHNPTRAPSSESQFSLMEFMREFPYDPSCLEHLWRQRYPPDTTTRSMFETLMDRTAA
jgi:hypothetical protein